MSKNKFLMVFILSTFFVFPFFSSAQTPNLQALIAELQKQVLELQKQIQDLKAELGQQIPQTSISTESQTTESTQESIPDFTRTLSRGISGDDVRKLQEFLKKDREIYPDGLITGYFGPKTEEALKKWQKKHNIEQAGILGPQTRARFQELGKGRIKELITEGAGISNIIPPGLLTAPGIQRKVELTATTTITTTTPKIPPRPDSCATSNNYCINSDECSKGGFYWCRNSCYATESACLGQSFVPPVQPAVPATPATPAQPTSQTSTTTVSAVPATPAVPAIVATSTTTGGDITSPSTPTGLTATSYSSYGITLTWSKSTDNTGVTGYKLYRNGTQIFSAATSTSLAVLSFTDVGLTPSTSYAYTVAAYDATGNVSAQSNAVSATTLAVQTVSSIPQVQGFTAVVSGSSVNLSWQDVTGTYSLSGSPSNMFGSYNIYRGSSADFIPSLMYPNANHIVQGSVLSYTDSNLAAGTYFYKISLQDKNGVVGPASSAVSAVIVGIVRPPAPTNIQAVTTGGAQSQPPPLWYYMTFDYTLQSTTQSFNIYRKRPTDASFVKYTYNAQTLVNASILPLPVSNESNLYRRYTNQWEWWTTLPAPAPASAAGEYQFYVTAVDTGGVESIQSQTKSLKIYAAPAIISPADGSTISSPLTITVSGDPNAQNPTYGMALYKKTTGDTAWSAWPAPSTNFTYPGSALNPSDNPHRLVVWLSANGSSFFGTSIFNIAATTSSVNFDTASRLAQILESLNNILNSLKLLR